MNKRKCSQLESAKQKLHKKQKSKKIQYLSQKLCKQHLPNVGLSNFRLEVKKSTIENAGLGLFATTDFRRGEIITQLIGELHDKKTANKLFSQGLASHMASLNVFEIIDARNEILYKEDWKRSKGIPVGGFVNHSFIKDNINSYLSILENVRCPKHLRHFIFPLRTPHFPTASLWIVALKDLKAGDEIFLDYGRNCHWDS
jgi:hypothetical protein